MSPILQVIRMNKPAIRRLLLSCAFLLVLAQVFFAVHAVGHLAGGDGESCQVCLLGGGVEQGAVDTPGPVLVIPPAPAETPVQAFSHDTGRTVFFRQRAPPHSPSV